jgi:hypothetical protein
MSKYIYFSMIPLTYVMTYYYWYILFIYFYLQKVEFYDLRFKFTI